MLPELFLTLLVATSATKEQREENRPYPTIYTPSSAHQKITFDFYENVDLTLFKDKKNEEVYSSIMEIYKGKVVNPSLDGKFVNLLCPEDASLRSILEIIDEEDGEEDPLQKKVKGCLILPSSKKKNEDSEL